MQRSISRVNRIVKTTANVSHKATALILAVLISCMVVPFGVRAAAGDLDVSFGSGGRVSTGFPPASFDRISALATQPDGKLVAGALDFAFRFAVLRYNQNGTLDSTFGSGGRVITNLDNSAVLAVAVQSDGKIIAAGQAHNPNPAAFDFTLVRYNTDGTIDSSFGSSGMVSTNFGTFDRIRDLAIQFDGKIVAVGDADISGDTNCALARYNPDGSLDTSFGSAGKVTTNFASIDSFADVVILPDGKIVAAGSVTVDFLASADFAVARYNSDGSLDSTFGFGGKVVTDFFGSADHASALAFQSDGKYVTAGIATEAGTTNQHFALARYNSDGSLDSSFGTNGKAFTAFGIIDAATALVIQPDGKLIAGGSAGFRIDGAPSDFLNFDFAIARYNLDGSLDSTFGSGGRVSTDFGGRDEAFDLVLQSDGKLVAGGAAGTMFGTQLGLARYETNVAGPRVIGASVQDKKLVVFGENFDDGAVILLEGVEQKTKNDKQNPTSILVGKKAGKKIKRGMTVSILIRNSNGTLSVEFRFTRPNG